MAQRKRLKRGDHLQLRSATWFYRRLVPEAIQGRLGREVVRTLRTSDVVEARRRSARLDAEVERLFEAAREGVVSGSKRAAEAAAEGSEAVERAEAELATICTQFARDSLLDDRRERRRLDDWESGDQNVDRGQVQEFYADQFEAGVLPTAETLAALKHHGVELSPTQFEALLREMRHAIIMTRGLIEADRDADIHGKPRVELPTLRSAL